MSSVDLNPFNAILARLEGVAERLERGVMGTPAASSAELAAPVPVGSADPPIAISFDCFVREKLPPIEQAAKALEVKDVNEATEMFGAGLKLLHEVLCASGHCCKPKDGDWPKLLGPVMELGQKAQRACDNRSEYFQNRKSVAEALNVMTLVTSPSPPTHVQNVLESMDFHAIKVMQKKKEAETSWVKALKAVVKELKEWCEEQCKLGLIWNAKGQDPKEYFAAHPLGSATPGEAAGKATASSSKGKGRGAAPPPPKGGFSAPPPEHFAQETAGGAAKTAGDGGGMAAVFSAISDFSTSKLKKVTPDMKTKNRPKEDAATPSTVPATAAPNTKAPAGKERTGKGPRGPPVKELQKELNWVIENFSGVPDLVLEEVEKQQLVCVINCRNTTLQIKDKVKSISIDGCERVNVICRDVISVVELVNSDRCQVQTLGKVNAFAIDKSNGVNLFLAKESLHAEIVTSKSSEMNVTIPEEGGEEGDTVEIPIPEQFVTRIVGPKKLQTEVSSLYSS